MNRYKELFSVGLIIFLLIIILFIMYFLNNYEINKIDLKNETNEQKFLSNEEILEVAKTDLEVLRLLSRDVEIIEGPRLVTTNDREKIPSIYPDYEPLYLIIIKTSTHNLYVVLNQTSVVNKVPLTSFI